MSQSVSDKIKKLANDFNFESIQGMLYTYLDAYPEEFGTIDILDIIDDLDIMYLRPRVLQDGRAKFVGRERAGYLKRYLEGKMYSSKEIAEKYIDCQIENAEEIIKECSKKGATIYD